MTTPNSRIAGHLHCGLCASVFSTWLKEVNTEAQSSRSSLDQAVECGASESEPTELRAVVLCQHFIVGLGGWRLNVVKPQRYGLGHRNALPPATPILSFDKGLGSGQQGR